MMNPSPSVPKTAMASSDFDETSPPSHHAALEARVTKLEQARYNNCPEGIVVDDCMRRARTAVEAHAGLYSARWKWVPSNYYDRSLADRAKILSVSSSKVLCKALLLENRKHVRDDDANNINNNINNAMTNPKFIMVILQYEAALDVKKLQNAIQLQSQLQSQQQQQQQQQQQRREYDFRVASPQDNARLTGYQFNSVTPFGLLQQATEIRMVLAKAIVEEAPYFWMGGGHVQLKLGMATSDFIASTTALVADISSPRGAGDTDDF